MDGHTDRRTIIRRTDQADDDDDDRPVAIDGVSEFNLRIPQGVVRVVDLRRSEFPYQLVWPASRHAATTTGRTRFWFACQPLATRSHPVLRSLIQAASRNGLKRVQEILGTAADRSRYSQQCWSRDWSECLRKGELEVFYKRACQWCGLPAGTYCDGWQDLNHLPDGRQVLVSWQCGESLCTGCELHLGTCPQCSAWCGLPDARPQAPDAGSAADTELDSPDVDDWDSLFGSVADGNTGASSSAASFSMQWPGFN